MPRNNGPNVTIAVRISADLHNQIRRVTQTHNYKENKMATKSEMIRHMLEIGLHEFVKQNGMRTTKRV